MSPRRYALVGTGMRAGMELSVDTVIVTSPDATHAGHVVTAAGPAREVEPARENRDRSLVVVTGVWQ